MVLVVAAFSDVDACEDPGVNGSFGDCGDCSDCGIVRVGDFGDCCTRVAGYGQLLDVNVAGDNQLAS